MTIPIHHIFPVAKRLHKNLPIFRAVVDLGAPGARLTTKNHGFKSPPWFQKPNPGSALLVWFFSLANIFVSTYSDSIQYAMFFPLLWTRMLLAFPKCHDFCNRPEFRAKLCLCEQGPAYISFERKILSLGTVYMRSRTDSPKKWKWFASAFCIFGHSTFIQHQDNITTHVVVFRLTTCIER